MSFHGVPRFYRNSLLGLRRALDAFKREDVAFVLVSARATYLLGLCRPMQLFAEICSTLSRARTSPLCW